MVHLAIVLEAYANALLDGSKRVESRLSRNRQPPYGHVAPGQLVYFKQRGGPLRAVATVESVELHENLTPDSVQQLCNTMNGLVRGDASYWEQKADARYAMFVWLTDVRLPTTQELAVKPPAMHGRGWLCMEQYVA